MIQKLRKLTLAPLALVCSLSLLACNDSSSNTPMTPDIPAGDEEQEGTTPENPADPEEPAASPNFIPEDKDGVTIVFDCPNLAMELMCTKVPGEYANSVTGNIVGSRNCYLIDPQGIRRDFTVTTGTWSQDKNQGSNGAICIQFEGTNNGVTFRTTLLTLMPGDPENTTGTVMGSGYAELNGGNTTPIAAGVYTAIYD